MLQLGAGAILLPVQYGQQIHAPCRNTVLLLPGSGLVGDVHPRQPNFKQGREFLVLELGEGLFHQSTVNSVMPCSDQTISRNDFFLNQPFMTKPFRSK